MERDKAEQYIWKITEYYDHVNDLDSAIDSLNEYANQIVIEELEEVLTKEIESFGVNVISSQAVINKIKQLKPDYISKNVKDKVNLDERINQHLVTICSVLLVFVGIASLFCLIIKIYF